MNADEPKPNPIVESAHVTPVDATHVWFTQICIVTHEINDEQVMAHPVRGIVKAKKFSKNKLAHIKDTSSSGLAKAIGKQIHRLRRPRL